MLTVYNTMTRKKEEFHPLRAGEVSIYCCGVTPYNDPHIGNARPFVTWDVIRRFLARKGYKVRYIQNFTDVDDKIIHAANREGVTWKEISDRYIAAYFKAMDALNVRRADVFPRVSETMEDILRMIETWRQGHALRSTRRRRTRWTSPSGRRQSPVNPRGRARGGRDAPAGTSSARRCP